MDKKLKDIEKELKGIKAETIRYIQCMYLKNLELVRENEKLKRIIKKQDNERGKQEKV